MATPKVACPFERPQASILDIAHNVVDLESHERHDPYYKAVDITKRMRVDIPDFDERIDPQVYSNWLATLETYFDWTTHLYLVVEEAAIEAQVLAIRLSRKHDTIEYMNIFEELKGQGHHGASSPSQPGKPQEAGLRRFQTEKPLLLPHTPNRGLSLRSHTRRTCSNPLPGHSLIRHGRQPLENLMTIVNLSDQHLRDQVLRTTLLQIFKNIFSMDDDRKKDKKETCFKCGVKGHTAWQCPKRNLLVDAEAEEAPEIEDNDTADFFDDIGKINVDDLEEAEEDTSFV
ncbi:hypothetical protein Acr_00g0047100 [Actinidia rufa]|uniref:CCHC-type domain-containing protein n=1 Tax=Actinidia rufa TaxID=165716 RepID=A0A7J0DJR7_9ERIC|nr:hypothetical protein Acr_00g0047100 [Actinidia rufa]